jgi:predicted nucleotidyltransferase
MVHPFIKDRLPQLTEIFKKHQVKKAYVFGSAVTGQFNESSDVDFLIEPLDPTEEPDPVIRGEILWDLYFALEDLLHRKVDMVTKNSLTNKYFILELDRTAVPIYG